MYDNIYVYLLKKKERMLKGPINLMCVHAGLLGLLGLLGLYLNIDCSSVVE
jgi:hypothetical protein